MRYLNTYMGSFLLFCAILAKDNVSQAILYAGSAVNFVSLLYQRINDAQFQKIC